jgi:WhiB family redox-sensing transcriptional regulator
MLDLFINDDHDFRHRAACRPARGASPDQTRELAEMFFPIARPGSPAYTQAVDAAKAICDGCPVRAECLAEALARAEKHGVLGGLDPEQRAELLASPSTQAGRQLVSTG